MVSPSKKAVDCAYSGVRFWRYLRTDYQQGRASPGAIAGLIGDFGKDVP